MGGKANHDFSVPLHMTSKIDKTATLNASQVLMLPCYSLWHHLWAQHYVLLDIIYGLEFWLNEAG